MRLLTHNVLRCPLKGVENGYPLRIEATDVQAKSEFNEVFVKHIASTLNWEALRNAAVEVGMSMDSLPEALSPALLEDGSFLQALHRVLMDMHVVEGTLVCPETGRRFPISQGIPNLM
ncbi:unnamed protein product [Choristocarpus tenellus]